MIYAAKQQCGDGRCWLLQCPSCPASVIFPTTLTRFLRTVREPRMVTFSPIVCFSFALFHLFSREWLDDIAIDLRNPEVADALVVLDEEHRSAP
jgi:hypothetical protein